MTEITHAKIRKSRLFLLSIKLVFLARKYRFSLFACCFSPKPFAAPVKKRAEALLLLLLNCIAREMLKYMEQGISNLATSSLAGAML